MDEKLLPQPQANSWHVVDLPVERIRSAHWLLPAVKKLTEDSQIERQKFGKLSNGGEAEIFRLKSSSGARASVTSYGATLTELWAPDASGKLANIVIGFDNLSDYLKCKCYYGATVGRVCNRIARGQFEIDGNPYKLALNNNTCCLHGGLKGFDKVLWDAHTSGRNSVVFNYISTDMEEGFPGNLHAQVTYTLGENNQLKIEFQATSDRPTLCNMTNHAYFNLKGMGNGTILDHQLMVDADYYTPVDAALIPTGEIKSVSNTPFDFRAGQVEEHSQLPVAGNDQIHTIGSRIKSIDGIYDHNFCLNGGELKLSQLMEKPRAVVSAVGRKLRLFCTQPGLQIFTSHNFHELGEQSPYYDYSGFTLETQHYPDAINQKNFPHDTILRPGQEYSQTLVFDFNP